MTVKPRDLGFDSFLDPTTPEKKLELNAENIYTGFKEGSYIQRTTNGGDVNCNGIPGRIRDREVDYKLKRVENLITHYEYKIILTKTDLTLDQKKIPFWT